MFLRFLSRILPKIELSHNEVHTLLFLLDEFGEVGLLLLEDVGFFSQVVLLAQLICLLRQLLHRLRNVVFIDEGGVVAGRVRNHTPNPIDVDDASLLRIPNDLPLSLLL